MLINNKMVEGNEFAYDGCHKIYIVEDTEDKNEAIETGYNILPIETLEETFYNSCDLRFISNWKLDISYVGQCEEVFFE